MRDHGFSVGDRICRVDDPRHEGLICGVVPHYTIVWRGGITEYGVHPSDLRMADPAREAQRRDLGRPVTVGRSPRRLLHLALTWSKGEGRGRKAGK